MSERHPHRVHKGQIESDCLHLLYMVAHRRTPEPQTYANLAAACGIPRITLWDIINRYKAILRAVAEQNCYTFRIMLDENYIIDVVYNGPLKEAET